MKKYRLEDANYIAIRDHINTQDVFHIVLDDNKMSDYQLHTLLEGIVNNNFQLLTKFSYSRGDFGMQSIQGLLKVIEVQQMGQS